VVFTFPAGADELSPAALQFAFAGQAPVFVQNLADRIQPAERSQVHVRERVLDLRHPALHRSLNSNRHFGGDDTDELSVDG
jgi:hypothetical protein